MARASRVAGFTHGWQFLRALPGTFWLLFLMVVTARTAGFAVPFLTLFLSQARGFTPEVAGVVLSFWGGGVLLAQLAGGILADRFGARRIMIASGLGAALCLLLFPATEGFLPLALLAFALGLTADMSRPAVAAVTAGLVPPEQRIYAFSTLYYGANIGHALSPLLATALFSVGWTLMFAVEAGALVLYAAIAAIALRNRIDAPRREAGPLRGMRLALRDPRLIALFGLALVYYFTWQQAYITLPLSMKGQGLEASAYAVVLTLNGVVVLLLTVPITSLVSRWTPGTRLILGLLLVGLGFAGHGVATTLWHYLPCVLIWTVGEILCVAAAQEAAAEIAPAGSGATYQGIVGAGWGLSGLVGPSLSGLWYASVPLPVFWLTFGILAGLATALFAWTNRRLAGTGEARA